MTWIVTLLVAAVTGMCAVAFTRPKAWKILRFGVVIAALHVLHIVFGFFLGLQVRTLLSAEQFERFTSVSVGVLVAGAVILLVIVMIEILRSAKD